MRGPGPVRRDQGRGGSSGMKAVHLLPFLPAVALTAAPLGAVTTRKSTWKYLPYAWTSLVAGTFFLLVYRGWERHVGPGPFRWAGFGLSPDNLFFVVLLVLVGPLAILPLAGVDMGQERRPGALVALGHLALAGSLVAVLGDHLILLVAGCAVGTWCAAGAAVLASGSGKERWWGMAALLPCQASDLCLVLSILFMALDGPSQELSISSLPVGKGGMPALALLVAAALLRLGVFPLNPVAALLPARGRSDSLPLAAMNPALGGYLLFLAWRALFSPGEPWRWALLATGVVSLVSASVFLPRRPGPGSRRGWMAACLGGGVILCFSAGGLGVAAAARLLLLAGIPALLLMEFSGPKGWRRIPGMVGAAAFMGVPPLAGFGTLWMAGRALGELGTGGGEVAFFLGWMVMAVAFTVVGIVFLLGGEERSDMPGWVVALSSLALCALIVLVGAYPGRAVDVLMREYGLPLEMPFSSWYSLAWAALAVAAGISVFWVVRLRVGGEAVREEVEPTACPTLVAGARVSSPPSWVEGKVARVAGGSWPGTGEVGAGMDGESRRPSGRPRRRRRDAKADF